MSSSTHAWTIEVSLPTPSHAASVNKAFDALEDELGQGSILAFCQADRPFNRLELDRSYTLQAGPETSPADERLLKALTRLSAELAEIGIGAEIKPQCFIVTYGAGEGSA